MYFTFFIYFFLRIATPPTIMIVRLGPCAMLLSQYLGSMPKIYAYYYYYKKINNNLKKIDMRSNSLYYNSFEEKMLANYSNF